MGIDSKENRAILKENGLSDIDIAAEREELYQQLKIQDASNADNNKKGKKRNRRTLKKHQQKHEESELLTHHIHKERDNSVYIDALLGLDPQICLVLKHITNLIEYGWLYSDHC